MNNISFLFENFQILEVKFSIHLIRRVRNEACAECTDSDTS